MWVGDTVNTLLVPRPGGMYAYYAVKYSYRLSAEQPRTKAKTEPDIRALRVISPTRMLPRHGLPTAHAAYNS